MSKYITILSFFLLFCIIKINAQTLLLENKGQINHDVLYYKANREGTVYYHHNKFSVYLRDAQVYGEMWQEFHHSKSLENTYIVKEHLYEVSFFNSFSCRVETKQRSSAYYNFYHSNNPKNWYNSLREYKSIMYKNLYSNVDFEVVTEANNVFKHNFIIHKNGKISDVKLMYRHIDSLEIKNNKLFVHHSLGKLIEDEPFAFQIINKDTLKIGCEYQIEKNGDAWFLSYKMGEYNPNFDLVIDPVLVFSTYSGSAGDNFGYTATYDSKFNLYAGGIVDGGVGNYGGPFPITQGAFQTVYEGGVGLTPANLACDIGINKFDSAGINLLYSTYLGGASDEYPHSLVVDNNDNLLIYGTTYSKNFPVDSFGYDTSQNGQIDIFLVKLSKDGTQMLGGTYFGGSNKDGLNDRQFLRYNYADDYRGDIIVDRFDNVYVASTTYSTNFPTKNAFASTRYSFQDACVFSLSSNLRELRFSTFLGGENDDAAYSIRIYGRNLYIGGGTKSANFPAISGGLNTSYLGGRTDGFIIKMADSGTVQSGTYFGTNAYDQVYFLDIDAKGNIYCAGQTDGNLNRSNNTYGKDNTSQFIARYNSDLKNRDLLTTFGNRTNQPEISPSAFLVDKCDNIYFSGWGSIVDPGLSLLTTAGLDVSPNAIQPTTDNNDFYLLVLSKNAQTIYYATYFGDPETEDHVDGGTSRFDKRGVVYQSVCASCPAVPGSNNQSFPVTNKAKFQTNFSQRCSNAAFKIDFQINIVVDASFTATPVKGCAPLNVEFNNTSQYSKKFIWNFGDGSPEINEKSPKHTFTKPGIYKVVLTSIDSLSCNVSEQDSLLIEVLDNPKADFEVQRANCSNQFVFKNKSDNYSIYQWFINDIEQNSSEKDLKINVEDSITRRVKLVVTHSNVFCKDSMIKVVNLSDPAIGMRVPNVFTPNDDNINNTFTIDGIFYDCYEVNVFIYNRWGQKIFEGELPDIQWNGRMKNSGDLLPEGVYYYLIKIKSKTNHQEKEKIINGVVHLIR